MTIKLGSSEAFASIATISGTGDWKIDPTTKSIWNGKKVGEGRDAKTEGTLITYLDGIYGSAATAKAAIFTATELASAPLATSAVLYSNIDLNKVFV